VATIRPDGTPHTAVTWYDWDDGRVLLNMADTRLRLRWMRPGAPVAVSVTDKDNFYRHISVLGHVAEVRPDVGLVDIDRLAQRYRGGSYPDREGARVSAWVHVDAWHGWDPERYGVLGPQARPGTWSP
jgi:PPOX class probable F420-dependent enzyme